MKANNNIPLVKPYLPPKEDLIPKITETLYSGYIAEGEPVYEFENKFSKLIGNEYCLATNSGTSALILALKLLDLTSGDEVISTALTAEPTNTAILNSGGVVVFADVDYSTGLISSDSIESRINKRTKAIMVVHYAGMVCNMDEINKISNKYDIPVIEDAAHAFLSKYKGKLIGSNSRFTIFSFQAIKHLTTVDGGMLCLNSQDDYKRAKLLRWFGLTKTKSRLDNNITEAGFKFNMNNLNAVIGNVQLEYLNTNCKKYIENGKYYDENLKNIPGVTIIPYYANTEPSYWLYTIKVIRRDDFVQYMLSNGVTVSPLHLRNDKHEVFSSKLILPNLDKFYSEFVHIPCGWWLEKQDREKIVSLIKKGW